MKMVNLEAIETLGFLSNELMNVFVHVYIEKPEKH